MAKKKRLIDSVRAQPKRIGGPGCLTCSNPGWAAAAEEYVDSLLDDDPDSLNIRTPVSSLFYTLTTDHERIGTEFYRGKQCTLRQHIRNCLNEKWSKVQKKRGRGGDPRE